MKSARNIRVQDLLSRPVQVVAGKGGVGRTTIACAIAVRSARDGARTLLLEVNSPDDVAACLGVEPAKDHPREVRDNLWICRMTPQGSLAEYALMVLRFKALYNLVFENKLVRYLLRSIPSLAEFTMLGKAWFHTTETLPDGRPKYERIIIDAPATGHAITFLSVARNVAEVSPPGVMKTAASRIADMVDSSEQTCLHVVCLPEEMPVNEGVELKEAASVRLQMSLGLGFMNRLSSPFLSAEEEQILAALTRQATHDPRLLPYVRAAARRLDRTRLQGEYTERFETRSGLPLVRVFEARQQEEGGVSPVEEAIRALDRAAGTGEWSEHSATNERKRGATA